MPAYPPGVRDEVLRVVASGVPFAAAARITGVSRVTVWRWVTEARQTGGPAPPPRTGKHPTITPAEEPALRAQAAEMPTATLAEHCVQWHRDYGVKVSRPTMGRALARLGLTPGRARSATPTRD